MKKKILSLCLVLALAAVAVVGGTLAYFTDTDAEQNVFTSGNVEIDLIEKFDEDHAKLIPGVNIEKKVTVKNIGSEQAYVRVHIAFPAILDSGSEDQPEFAAYNNTLHWNFTNESVADGQWNWNLNKDGENYPGNGGDWNFYTTEIDGIDYNVYVATYESALDYNAVTETAAMTKVYLDTKVTNEAMTEIMRQLNGSINVYVFAEGGQTATFDNAYDALNTQFGVPGQYDTEINWKQAAEHTVASPSNP